jgi:hypothetical protein
MSVYARQAKDSELIDSATSALSRKPVSNKPKPLTLRVCEAGDDVGIGRVGDEPRRVVNDDQTDRPVSGRDAGSARLHPADI